MHCPSQKYGTVTEDFIFNNVCGTTYNGIQMPSVEEIQAEIALLQKAANNGFSYGALTVTQPLKAVLNAHEENNPSSYSTPKLDLALFILGADIDSGYHILDNNESKWEERKVGNTFRDVSCSHKVYQTNAIEVKLRQDFIFKPLWESNNFTLTSSPYQKEVQDVTTVGDWVDPKGQEEDI